MRAQVITIANPLDPVAGRELRSLRRPLRIQAALSQRRTLGLLCPAERQADPAPCLAQTDARRRHAGLRAGAGQQRQWVEPAAPDPEPRTSGLRALGGGQLLGRFTAGTLWSFS